MIIKMLVALEIVWIIACVLFDWFTRRVPNWHFLVGGGITLVHVSQGWRSGEWQWGMLSFSILHVALALSLWHWGPWGGADAKFWIILAFLFPSNVLLATIVISHVVLGIFAVVRWMRQQAARPLPGIPLMGAGLLLSPYVLSWLQ